MKLQPPPSSFHPGHRIPTRAWIASPPIQVWIPNQPQATRERRREGTWAPMVPKEARTKTGNGIPYRVPAWALITSGTRTMAFPSRMASRLCHQFIPASIMLEASM